MSLLLPRALRPGDVVAVAALSGGLEPEELEFFEPGIRAIEALGFLVQVSPLVDPANRRWWSVSTPDVIAGELNRLLRDPEVRAIFALTGGRATLSYLDLVDYDAVLADPKPVLGFSDIDALLLALHSRTGLVGIHSNLVTAGFGDFGADHEALAAAHFGVLTGEVVSLPASRAAETWRGGVANGPLLGGLLNRLVRLQATPFAFGSEAFDGAILFIEEVGTGTSQIWNDLQALRLAGVFDRIGGLIVGSPAMIEEDEGVTLQDVVLDAVGDRELPILGNADIAHNPPNLPLPLGIQAKLDASARSIALLEAAVDRG